MKKISPIPLLSAGQTPSPSPEPGALMLFADIADAGSVTLAARRMGLSQPALSKQLKRLEDQLGVALFERSQRGIRASEYGQALLPRARTIRAQVAQAGQDILQRRGQKEGRITLALSHFATIALLPQVIGGFLERWPQVMLDIIPPTFDLQGLREGRPDFAVMSIPQQKLSRDWSARPLYTTSVVVVARPGHPLLGAESLRDLANAQWVLPSQDSSVTHGLKNAFRKAKLPAPVCGMTCQTLTGLETLVRNTDFLAAMPVEVFEDRRRNSGLLRLPIPEPIEGPRVAIFRWADAHPTPASAYLESAFIEVAHRLAKQNRGKPFIT